MLEGDDRVDVLLARAVSTTDGVTMKFEACGDAAGHSGWMTTFLFICPASYNLIAAERFAARPRIERIFCFLEALREQGDH